MTNEKPNLARILQEGFESDGLYGASWEFFKKGREGIIYDPDKDRIIIGGEYLK